MPGSARVMPRGTSAGRRADDYRRQQRGHRSGSEQHPGAAPVGPESQYAAPGWHEGTPFVTSPATMRARAVVTETYGLGQSLLTMLA